MTRISLVFIAAAWLSATSASAQQGDVPSRPVLAGVPTQATEVPGPTLRFDNLTVDDGLSGGSVHAIVQDYLGYMWFGTSGGLDRFDGTEFVNYKPVPFDSTSISDTVINGLFEDRDRTLWITTQRGGLNLLGPDRRNFKRYTHDEDDPTSIGYGTLCKVHPARSDAKWICTLGGGIDRFDPETETFEHFRHDAQDSTSLSNNYVYDAYEDPSGYTWIATGNGLNRLNPERTAFTRFFHVDERGEAAAGVVLGSSFRYIHPDASDPYLLWLGNGEGLIAFDARTGRHRRYLSTFVYSIADDPNERDVLWIAASGENGGLFRFDTRTGEYSHYRHDPLNDRSLISDQLFSIAVDASGMIWTGSANGRGLSRFDPKGVSFRHIGTLPSRSGALSRPVVWSVQEDRAQRLWVSVMDAGGRGEINRLDRRTGESQVYASRPGDPSGLGTGIPAPLFISAEEDVWVGTGDGLELLDPSTGRVRRYAHRAGDPTSLSGNRVTAIYQSRSGDLWAGTSRGLNHMRRDRAGFVRYFHDPQDDRYVPDRHVLAILEDHDGLLWVGMSKGLYTLDPSTGETKAVPRTAGNPQSLSDDLIYALHERPREPGVIWVGTQSGGLNRLDTRRGTVKTYSTSDVLPDNQIYAILEDDRGRLWLSTNKGLSCFDPATETAVNYGVRHGLQSMEFNHGAAYKSASGEMFFGGPNGLNAFFPDRIETNRIPPMVAVTGFRIFNDPVEHGPDSPLAQPIWQTEAVRLAHDRNTVSFDVQAFHYQHPASNAFAYRLDPVDADWVEAGAARSATYSNLSPGTYAFRVKAANGDGVWSSEKRIEVSILPPWWRTPWAYALYVLLAAAAILTVDRVQRRRVITRERERARIREARLKAESAQEQAAALEQLDLMKSRFFANLSHEFRTPLTLILDPLERMIDQADDDARRQLYTMMRHQARRLLHLIEQLLDLSKFDAGGMTLRARPIELVSFLRNLVFAFASRAERENISLQAAADEEAVTVYAEPDKLEKIFTNLLTNAFKFTPPHGKIRVSLERREVDDGASVVVVVRDTGQGIPDEELPHVFDRFYQVDASLVRRHEGAGIGLALTKELVELHGGEIEVESEAGFGTSFYVRLPLGRDHLDPGDLADVAGLSDGGSGPSPESEDWSEAIAFDDEDVSPPDDAPLVLLVDDNDDVRRYLRRHLGRHYRVETAGDGVEACEKAATRCPDLVVADVMMPRMDGYSLCRRMKSDEQTAHVPVILLTAKASVESKVEGFETGADDYIYKPFLIQELLIRAENLIEVRRALRDRFSGEVVVRPTDVTVPSQEAEFLEHVRTVVDEEIGNSAFTVEMLADRVGMSTRQLYRRLKKSANLSPGGFIRTMRLKRAAQLLEQDAGNISEIAYAVGFNDADYFSRLFRQTYGTPPSEYVKDRT